MKNSKQHIKKISQERKRVEWHEIVLSAVMLLGFLVVIIYLFVEYPLWMHSDTSNANILAREQILSRSLYPRDFIYMQEIQGIFLNLPIAFLSLFSNDQMLIHNWACVFFIAIGIASLIVFYKKGIKCGGWLICVPLVFGGMSSHTADSWAEMLLSQTAYLPILFNTFFALTLFLTAVDVQNNFKITNLYFFAAFNIYIIVMGITGYRYLQIIVLPLLCAIFIHFFIEHLNLDTKQLWTTSKAIVLLVFIVAFFALLGIVGFAKLKQYVMFTPGITSMQTFVSTPEEITANISGMIRMVIVSFGYRMDVPMLSIDGAVNAIKIFASVLFTIVLPLLLLRRHKEQSAEIQLFSLFVLSSVAIFVVMAIFVRQVMPVVRYGIPPIMLLIAMSSIYIWKYWLEHSNLIRLTVVVGFCTIMLSSHYQILLPLSMAEQKKDQLYSITNFLSKHNLEFGYATYWNSNVNTVISDFRIQINAINYSPEGDISPFGAFVSTYRYKPEYYNGPSFLMLTDGENVNVAKDQIDLKLGLPESVLTCSGYTIYVYNYNIAEKLWA